MPSEVLAGWTVSGLMLLCQGAPLDLAPIVGRSHWWLWGLWWWSFWGVLAVQEVWEPELHLRLWVMSPGTFPPPIQLDQVLDSSLFATGPNWLFSQPRHAQELLLGGENCPAGGHGKSLTQSA